MGEKITGTVALRGNPNVGKTTLFNSLTGSNQYVGKTGLELLLTKKKAT